jgi:hypothetical protein
VDYQTLPLEERITLASQYAVLLVADGGHADSIVEELTGMFHLTHEQARQAYEKMRTENGPAYQANIHKYYLQALTAAGLSVFGGLFFYFIGTELRSSGFGIAFLLLAIFSALQVLDILTFIGRLRSEQKRGAIPSTFTQTLLRKIFRVKYRGSKSGKFETGMILIIGYSAIMLLLVTCENGQEKGTVNASDLITSTPKVLYKKPWKEWISNGDYKHFVYYFSFYEDRHLYRFDETYINYQSANYYLDSMAVGDTITIQFAREDSSNINMRDASFSLPFKIYNIARQGIPYADLAARNKKVAKDYKATIRSIIIFSIVIVVLYIIYGQYRKGKYKKLTAARTNATT